MVHRSPPSCEEEEMAQVVEGTVPEAGRARKTGLAEKMVLDGLAKTGHSSLVDTMPLAVAKVS
jgi:hypothetical protein